MTMQTTMPMTPMTVETVSYTHLDVYKRQPRSGRGPGPADAGAGGAAGMPVGGAAGLGS